MPSLRPIEYRGRVLGQLKVYGKEDWKNPDREPDEKDFLMIGVTAAADAAFEVMEAFPVVHSEEEPELPWPMVVLREVTRTLMGRRDSETEDKVLMTYLQRRGVNQLISIWGDPQELLNRIREVAGEDLEDFEGSC